MNKLTAKIISFILNPLVILVFIPFYLVYKTTGEVSSAISWTIISCIFIFLFFVFIAIGVKLKYFSDLDISLKTQRFFLYFFAILLAIIYLLTLLFMHAPKALFIGVFGLMLGLLVLEAGNKYLKISVHVATITAFVTSIILIHRNPYYLLGYLFVFLLAWSRIELKKHTFAETAAGGILGAMLSIIVYIIGKQVI